MIEFGYYYYDSPKSVIGPVSEEEAKNAADNDLSCIPVYREESTGPWYLFDYKSEME